MSSHSLFETLLGAFILILSVFLLGYSYMKTSYAGSQDGYTIIAKFSRVDGMSIGADVRISGVKVGKIQDLVLDSKTYLAQAVLKINKDIKIPKDSSAEIVGEGLLGAKYLSISVGNSDVLLKEGERITNTQGSMTIESLISKFMFSKESK